MNLKTPQLLVIVLNYRTPALTIECLRSLAPEVTSFPGVQVVVVDNNSGDGSIEQILRAAASEGWSSWVTVHPAKRNGGFAFGNNRGYELFPAANYVLLLNSDTLVHQGCFGHCLDAMNAEPDIGALSCRVLNRDGTNQNVCRRFPTPLRLTAAALGLPYRWPRLFEWADTEDLTWVRTTVPRDVEWIGGAFMLLRGDVVRQTGLLDEDFFFYGEDIEICHRVWRHGFRVRYDPAVTITHLGGASSDPTRMPEEKCTDLRWQARYLVQRKCFGRLAERYVRLLDRMIYRLRILRCKMQRRTDEPGYAALCANLAILQRLPR